MNENDEDIGALESIAQFAAGVAKRNCGIDVGPVRGLTDLLERLNADGPGEPRPDSP